MRNICLTAQWAAAFLTTFALQAFAEESPKDIIAAQVRAQGHICVSPRNAARDVQNSRPDGAGWVLECENASYRVRLIPHRAAQVEVIP